MILPVRNGEQWIAGCLASLASQTFRDFETILLDHESTDGTVALALESGLRGLRVVPVNGVSLGDILATGVLEARSDIVVRMDVDDRAFPDRIAKQVTRLRAEPRLVACGTWATVRSESSRRTKLQRMPISDAQLRLGLYVGNPFIHSTMALRRAAVLAAGNYRGGAASGWPEDLDLWMRLAETGLLTALPEPLVHRILRADGLMGGAGQQINEQAGCLLQERWRDSDVPALVRAAPLASCFVDRRRRLTPGEAARLAAGLVALGSRAGWPAAAGAWRASTWVRPALWALLPPRH